MFIIPFQTDADTFNVFVALQDDNLERMKAYDPAQLEPLKMGQPWASMKLGVVIIGYASDADFKQADELFHAGRLNEIPTLLSRGFKFAPERGDHDGPYTSMTKEKKLNG